MLESTEKPTIVYTDHSATLGIIQQSSLTSTVSIDKLNLQLVRASEYLLIIGTGIMGLPYEATI